MCECLTATDPKIYPSRLRVPRAGSRLFGTMFRRLNRIYAHAYWCHNDVFWQNENVHHPYEFMVAVNKEYALVEATEMLLDLRNHQVPQDYIEYEQIPASKIDWTPVDEHLYWIEQANKSLKNETAKSLLHAGQPRSGSITPTARNLPAPVTTAICTTTHVVSTNEPSYESSAVTGTAIASVRDREVVVEGVSPQATDSPHPRMLTRAELAAEILMAKLGIVSDKDEIDDDGDVSDTDSVVTVVPRTRRVA